MGGSGVVVVNLDEIDIDGIKDKLDILIENSGGNTGSGGNNRNSGIFPLNYNPNLSALGQQKVKGQRLHVPAVVGKYQLNFTFDEDIYITGLRFSLSAFKYEDNFTFSVNGDIVFDTVYFKEVAEYLHMNRFRYTLADEPIMFEIDNVSGNSFDAWVNVEYLDDINTLPNKPEVENPVVLGSITVDKTDLLGNPLTGAVFNLLGAGTKTTVNGIATWENLEMQSYTLKEIEPPEGHLLIDNRVEQVVLTKENPNQVFEWVNQAYDFKMELNFGIPTHVMGLGFTNKEMTNILLSNYDDVDTIGTPTDGLWINEQFNMKDGDRDVRGYAIYTMVGNYNNLNYIRLCVQRCYFGCDDFTDVSIKIYDNRNQIIEDINLNVPPDSIIKRGRGAEDTEGIIQTDLNNVYTPLLEFNLLNKTVTNLWK